MSSLCLRSTLLGIFVWPLMTCPTTPLWQFEEARRDQAQALVLSLQPAPLRRCQEGRGGSRLCTASACDLRVLHLQVLLMSTFVQSPSLHVQKYFCRHVWQSSESRLLSMSAQIEKLQAMSASDLDTAISTKEKEISAAESNFKVRLESVV